MDVRRRKILTAANSKSKSKKSSSRKPGKSQNPELLPCLIDINPSNPKKVFNTPSSKKKSTRFRPRKYSFTDSRLSENNNPGQVSNFKKRVFSNPQSHSKLSKIQNPTKNAKYYPNQRVIVPLNSIVHERCYNQYLFPNKTLWKYLNSIERIQPPRKPVKSKLQK